MRTSRSQKTQGLVMHRNVALMVCEDPVVFEEIFNELELDELNYQRVGSRALLVPAQELARLSKALEDRGVYPKVMGEPVVLTEATDEEN